MPNRNETAGSPRWRTWLAVVLILAVPGGIVWLKKRGPVGERATPASVVPAPVRAPLPPLLEPQEKVFAQYAGSTNCRECHAGQFATWEKSNHGLAERLPSAAMDAAAFAPTQTFTHGTQTSSAAVKDGRFNVETPGFGGKRGPYEVARVIGHDPLRQFLVARPDGRFQALEVAFDPRKHQWFDVYGAEDRKPGEWGHWTGRGMNWNNMCASCHNTRLRKNYDEQTDSYRTAMAEMSVGCESCHGPMKAHADWRRQNPRSSDPEPSMRRLDRDQVFDTCGSCHARRRELTGDFVPGDAFHQHYQLTTVDGSDLYFADGKVRDELYEYGSFLSSKMHAAGVRCADCHDPHRAKVRAVGNDLCQTCHAGGTTAPGGTIRAPVIDPAAHSFHQAAGAGAQCVNCHMPQTVYMQRHKRHDHGFTIPDPLLTKQHGIPNACNQCHADKDAEWAVSASAKWWGEKMNRPSRERAQRIAAARTGSHDAGAPLITLLRDEPSPYWKASLLRLLLPWAGEAEASRAFLEYAQHADPLVRTAAAQGLEFSGDAAAAAPARQVLTRRLEDASRSVRASAAWALRDSVDETTRAGRDLLHALEIGADQPAGQLQRGAWAMARREPAAALSHFARAVEWDPNSAPIRHEYAVALSMMNRPQDSLKQMQEAARLEPGNAEFRHKLALAWNEAGSLADALREFAAAVKLDPKHSRAWYNLGLALSAQGKAADAIAALRSGEAADPRDARIPYARATIHARLGQAAEARAACEAALALAPQMQEARQLLEALR